AGVVIGVEAHHPHVLQRAGGHRSDWRRSAPAEAARQLALLAQRVDREQERQHHARGEQGGGGARGAQCSSRGIMRAATTSSTTMITAVTPSLRRSEVK